MNKLTVKETIGFGWRKVKENMSYVVLWTLAIMVVGALTNGPGVRINGGRELFNLIGLVAGAFLAYGSLRLAIKLLDGVKGDVNDFYMNWKTFWHVLLTQIAYGLIVFIGTILLIVPGIIFALRYSQALFLVVDKGMDPFEAFKESARMTYGHKWELFFIMLAMFGIVILGAIALVVGLLLALPTVLLASAYIYRKLLIPVPVVEQPMTPEVPPQTA